MNHLHRPLHPLAWWAWALGLATAASRTTNPLILLLVLAAAGLVVTTRRTAAPWARAYRYYLALGLSVIVLRVLFRAVFGGTAGGESTTTLLRLPEIPLPHWMAGVHLGGALSAESLLGATYDGLRLATLLCCLGAANTLANPKRALRCLPGALHEVGVAVVVAMSVAPQLVESLQRVRRARRLRGVPDVRRQALRSLVMPVPEDALDRSLLLAAAMDSRGYGRRAAVAEGQRRTVAGLLIGGLLALCIGAYGALDGTVPVALGLPALLLGGALCVVGMALGGGRVSATRYRPDPWRVGEWAVAGCGIGAAVLLVLSASYDAADLNPSLSPLSWPTLPLVPVIAIVLAALPTVLAPQPVVPQPVRPSRPAPERVSV